MKFFKSFFPTTLLLLFFLTLGIVQNAYAQDAQKAKATQIAKTMTDSMTFQLSLTPQQASSVQDINETAVTQLLELSQKKTQDSTLKGGAMAKQVMAVMKQRDESVQKLLTPEQQKKYEEIKTERMAELQTQMMRTQLDLTDEQVPKVYQINYKYAKMMKANMGKAKESDRKRGKAKAMKEAKSDSAEKDKELKGVLTEEQYKVYEQNKQEMQAAIREKMQEKKKGN
jgi:hypothetical protein